MTDNQDRMKQTRLLIVLAVAIFGIWVLSTLFSKPAAHQVPDMEAIYKKVATDAVEQYEIVKKSGSVIDLCVRAGFVKAAFLQAKDSRNYEEWAAIEQADCQKAGIRR